MDSSSTESVCQMSDRTWTNSDKLDTLLKESYQEDKEAIARQVFILDDYKNLVRSNING